MADRRQTGGFSLIEMLLVLVIIGIISAIAIPSYLGQRRRSRVIGDAIANAKIMAMMLEAQRADTGTYGSVATYNWTAGSALGSAGSLLPGFTPKGNSNMNYTLAIGSSGLGYQITVFDPSLGTNAYITDQSGAQIFRLQ